MTSGLQPPFSGAPTPVQGVTGGPPVLGGQISNDPNTGNVVVAPNPGQVLQVRKGNNPTALQVYEYFHTNTDYSRIALNSQTGGPFQLAVETNPPTVIRELDINANGPIHINGGSAVNLTASSGGMIFNANGSIQETAAGAIDITANGGPITFGGLPLVHSLYDVSQNTDVAVNVPVAVGLTAIITPPLITRTKASSSVLVLIQACVLMAPSAGGPFVVGFDLQLQNSGSYQRLNRVQAPANPALTYITVDTTVFIPNTALPGAFQVAPVFFSNIAFTGLNLRPVSQPNFEFLHMTVLELGT